MDIRKLQRAIVDGLEDVKAQHIAVFNTEHLSALFERVIIASGTSNRQTKALAASVRDAVKGRGMDLLSVEGEDNGEWIIVDCGAAVVHIMQPAIREYYHLEEIWGGKTVRVKIGEVNTRLVKASEPEPAPKKARKIKAEVRAGHDAVRPARTRNAARDAAGEMAAPPAQRAPARAARPTAEVAEHKATKRTAAFKRVAAKTPARKTASRVSTAPATKTIVVKAAGQSAARKSPAAKKAAAPRPARKTAARSK
jgi:ribosome-associated protein